MPAQFGFKTKTTTTAPAAQPAAAPTPAPVPQAGVAVPGNTAVATPPPQPAAHPTPAPKAKKSLVKAAPAPAPVAVADEVTDVEVLGSEPNLPAVQSTMGKVGGFVGEWSAKDMATPYLALCGKMSKIFDTNPDWLGHFVYDKQITFGDNLKVVFLTATKYYIEALEFGSEQIPQRFYTMKDARAAGFNEGSLQEICDLDVLVEFDADAEGVAELAHIIDGDKAYLLCRYPVRSTAFGRTAGVLLKDLAGFLKGCLFNGYYELSSDVKVGEKGSYHVPKLKTAGPTPQSLRNLINEKFNGVEAAA